MKTAIVTMVSVGQAEIDSAPMTPEQDQTCWLGFSQINENNGITIAPCMRSSIFGTHTIHIHLYTTVLLLNND